jgi:hypothetical protein
MVVEFTDVATQSLVATPATDGSPTPPGRRLSGCADSSLGIAPMSADPSARYMCSLCESACSYLVVRHTGRCPTCGGGLVRQPDTSEGSGAI